MAFNKKTFFFSRIIVGLIFALGFYFIIFLHNDEFTNFSATNNVEIDQNSLNGISNYFNQIFQTPKLEEDAFLKTVTFNQNDEIVFIYQFIKQPNTDDKILKDPYIKKQQLRFCNKNEKDRLSKTKGYRFIYNYEENEIFSFLVNSSFCQLNK